MKRLICIMIFGALVGGCAGGQAQALRQAYDRGELSAAEYYSLDQRRREAESRALDNYARVIQTQQAINAMNRPQIIWFRGLR